MGFEKRTNREVVHEVGNLVDNMRNTLVPAGESFDEMYSAFVASLRAVLATAPAEESTLAPSPTEKANPHERVETIRNLVQAYDNENDRRAMVRLWAASKGKTDDDVVGTRTLTREECADVLLREIAKEAQR